MTQMTIRIHERDFLIQKHDRQYYKLVDPTVEDVQYIRDHVDTSFRSTYAGEMYSTGPYAYLYASYVEENRMHKGSVFTRGQELRVIGRRANEGGYRALKGKRVYYTDPHPATNDRIYISLAKEPLHTAFWVYKDDVEPIGFKTNKEASRILLRKE